MASFSGTGGIVDPGITGMAGKNMDSIVQLQTAIGVFTGNLRTGDLIAYAICLPILLIWVYLTLNGKPAGKGIWLALAVAAPLSMLPTYHFQHDAKLLLLAIPGCALLWAKRGPLGWFSLLVTLAGILFTGDIFTAARILLTSRHHRPAARLCGPSCHPRLHSSSAARAIGYGRFLSLGLWSPSRDAVIPHTRCFSRLPLPARLESEPPKLENGDKNQPVRRLASHP